METPNRKILIVDDHEMIRDGITVMLQARFPAKFLTIHEAESGEQALEKLKRNQYDLIIIDYKLPNMNGADTTRSILHHYPKTKVLALSNSDEYANIKNMLISGAMGFVLKNITPAELESAIEHILKGRTFFSQEIAGKMMADVTLDREARQRAKHSNFGLTSREIEVLRLLAQNMNIDQICDHLSISTRTLATHRAKIYQKLDLKKRGELVAWAIKHKFV